jgi:hypothetical protein
MNEDVKLTPEEVAVVRQRRIEAMHLQIIEGNPLTAEDVAMFEMFDREGWSHQRRLEYLQKLGRELARTHDAK